MDSKKTILEKAENENLPFKDKIQYLKEQRCLLLEEIHKKQQLLDQIDYLIYKLK